MIEIYRGTYDSEINFFHGKEHVSHNEVVIKTKGGVKCAEPVKPGYYAFGGTFLYTSNGIFPEFNKPIALHDRQMDLEV